MAVRLLQQRGLMHGAIEPALARAVMFVIARLTCYRCLDHEAMAFLLRSAIIF